MRILAIDPGREKCGMAICDPEKVLAHRVVSTRDLPALASEWLALYRVDLVLVGNRTSANEVLALLRPVISTPGVPVESRDEQGTTLAARSRYFRDHPPGGWRRWWPRSLQLPPEPYDDYAAIVLAEAYLRTAAKASKHPSKP